MSKTYKNHYDCSYLVNALDADGEKPCFYIVCSAERGPGKTFSFSKLLYTNFIEKGEKFILLTRNMGELGNIASGIFDGYLQCEHPDVSLEEKIQMKGVFSRVYSVRGTGENQERVECGYVIPIRAADKIKKISSLFYDATCFYFDEFQPSDESTYLKDEVGLLMNIYKSVARGDGSAVRHMAIYMASNTIQIGNPYFIALGLTGKIQKDSKFYRGHGVVFERCEVEGLKELHESSAIDRALANYKQRKGDNTWINDNNSLVAKPEGWGHARYQCTICWAGCEYGVYVYANGLRYISRKTQKDFPYVYNLELDGDLNIPLMKTVPLMDDLKKFFYRGLVRVSDSEIQSMLMTIFS